MLLETMIQVILYLVPCILTITANSFKDGGIWEGRREDNGNICAYKHISIETRYILLLAPI
jgi:hypothetical protein